MIWILGFAMGGCTRTDEPPEAWPERVCEADAPVVDASPSSTRDDQWLIMADDVALAVAVRRPERTDCAAVLVEVPPGFEAGLEAVNGEQAKTLSRAGAVVVTFDPRGRGESEGEEDINGSLGQDDFAAVLRWAAGLAGVDSGALVVYSRFIGGALAAGALGRHDDLQPSAWVDYESPGWLEEDMDHTTEHTHDRMWALADATSDPSAWFLERSPAAFIGEVDVPYHRLQGIPDHALDSMEAAVAMLNGATASPLVTLNGEPVTSDLSATEIQEAAIGGGVDPSGDWATEQILDSF